MQRSILLAFSLALMIFVISDSAIYLLIEALSGHGVALAFLGQITSPFWPIALAGLAAGYLGTPWGSRIAFLASIAGQFIVFILKYNSYWSEAISSALNVASIAGWTIGSALMCGVCGWAGERLHAKL